MHDHDEEGGGVLWAAFGDLMACLFGIFVLFFAWMVLFEVDLSNDLAEVRAEHEAAEARLDELESALAGPLASGLITLTDGRIGIRGSVLFDSSSAELRQEGKDLLRQLAGPLQGYLEHSGETAMVSGFTDDLQLRRNGSFADNWELSVERALTVVRTLTEAGFPPGRVFAAGFGAQHPIASNADEEGRALNRRVEIAPVPAPLLERLTASTQNGK
ncbi:MAG: hypothetical protein CMN30_11135 [Sandaracinus sp.]|nr:hypothetical protein [Sandaracinus sp.]|tara:strand:- start:61 stop:708 length:648 start_codon:yes stop_codon:yes gene_type:complete